MDSSIDLNLITKRQVSIALNNIGVDIHQPFLVNGVTHLRGPIILTHDEVERPCSLHSIYWGLFKCDVRTKSLTGCI